MSEFTIEEEPLTTELTNKVDRGFSEHGFEATGFEEQIFRKAFVARDGEAFVGCVTANILWRTLHIRFMFIEAPYRHKGLGTALIEKALEYGKSHGCSTAFVDTLSFQALGFYQKLGFEIEFTRTGFAHGVAMHYLKKSLS
jgi:GNAT superfamily N-acetyltransferase